jgi:hypothetical protein
VRVFQRDAALAQQQPEPAAPGRAAASDDGLVTLMIVRAAGPDDALALRARLEAALPAGTRVEARRVTRAEADRLLHGH